MTNKKKSGPAVVALPKAVFGYYLGKRVLWYRLSYELWKDRSSKHLNSIIYTVLRRYFHEDRIPNRYRYYWLAKYGGIDGVVGKNVDLFSCFHHLWEDGFAISGKQIDEGMTGVVHNGLDLHEI